MATMTKKKSSRQAVAGALAIAKQIRRLPASSVWLDFDEEADVLYISFHRPQNATETVELEDGGILLRYRGKQLVGITVLYVSQR